MSVRALLWLKDFIFISGMTIGFYQMVYLCVHYHDFVNMVADFTAWCVRFSLCYQRAYITWLPNTKKHPVSSCTFKSIYCWILFAFTLLRICVYVWINVFLSFSLFLLSVLILPLKNELVRYFYFLKDMENMYFEIIFLSLEL